MILSSLFSRSIFVWQTRLETIQVIAMDLHRSGPHPHVRPLRSPLTLGWEEAPPPRPSFSSFKPADERLRRKFENCHFPRTLVASDGCMHFPYLIHHPPTLPTPFQIVRSMRRRWPRFQHVRMCAEASSKFEVTAKSWSTVGTIYSARA